MSEDWDEASKPIVVIPEVTRTTVDQLAKDWLPNIFNDPDLRECIEACDKILQVKGNDYTQGRGDKERLANFYECAKFFGMTPFQALGNYWYKHVTAIFRFLKEGAVESEPIAGRVHDAINYLFLLYKLIKVEKRQ